MCKCNCNDRKEMLENSLNMYEGALVELERKILGLNEKELVYPNVRKEWEEKADLMSFYEKEIYKLKKELKVYTCQECNNEKRKKDYNNYCFSRFCFTYIFDDTFKFCVIEQKKV